MRRTSFLLVAVALVVGAPKLSAQAPNFAGTWTRIVDPNAPPTGGAVPDAMTIVQDSKAVTMTVQSTDGNDATIVFNLDGTDSKRMMTDGNGNQYELVTRAKWDGSTLVATMIRDPSTPATYACSLDASGKLMVAGTLPAPGGG